MEEIKMQRFSRTAVMDKEGKFLLIHTTAHGRNRWEFPGGKSLKGESTEETAYRELQEETGLISQILIPVFRTDTILLDDDYWVGSFFYTNSYDGTPQVMEPNKADKVDWFTVEQMKLLPTIPLLSLEVARLLMRPKIVCLCGSTKFHDEFVLANYQETMKGHIVLSVGFFMHTPQTVHGQTLGCTPGQKIKLDQLHKKKIEMADEILVLDIGGYIGDSTRSEIEHAEKLGKHIRYISKEGW
jgi:8-oxo-dGTP pyrophosphatase MutT (NUDIX family)